MGALGVKWKHNPSCMGVSCHFGSLGHIHTKHWFCDTVSSPFVTPNTKHGVRGTLSNPGPQGALLEQSGKLPTIPESEGFGAEQQIQCFSRFRVLATWVSWAVEQDSLFNHVLTTAGTSLWFTLWTTLMSQVFHHDWQLRKISNVRILMGKYWSRQGSIASGWEVTKLKGKYWSMQAWMISDRDVRAWASEKGHRLTQPGWRRGRMWESD